MNTVDITLNDLSPRQREIVRLLVDGISTNQKLAEAMNVKQRTVESHLVAIFDKLDIVLARRNKTALMGWGIRQLQAAGGDDE